MIKRMLEFIFLTTALVWGVFQLQKLSWESFIINHTGVFLLSGTFIFMAYVLRLLRIYLLVLEKNTRFKELSLIFIKTSFVGWILPFKLGEIYRLIRYGDYLNSYKAGLMFIWIERFLDSVVLIALLIGAFFTGTMFTQLFLLTVSFVLVTFFVYYSFPVSYRYTKKVLLTKSNTKRGLFYLKITQNLMLFFNEARELIRGRGTILLTISALLWFFEILTFIVLSTGLNRNISVAVFMNYYNSLLSTNNSMHDELIVRYVITSLGILAVSLFVTLSRDLLGLRKWR